MNAPGLEVTQTPGKCESSFNVFWEVDANAWKM